MIIIELKTYYVNEIVFSYHFFRDLEEVRKFKNEKCGSIFSDYIKEEITDMIYVCGKINYEEFEHIYGADKRYKDYIERIVRNEGRL